MGYNYLTKPAKMEKKHWGECQHIHKISKGGYNLNFDYRRVYQNLDLRFVDIFVSQWEIYSTTWGRELRLVNYVNLNNFNHFGEAPK